MKGTELFKAAIQNYLEYRAMTDDLFAPRYANPAKNIDDCITRVLVRPQIRQCTFHIGIIFPLVLFKIIRQPFTKFTHIIYIHR